MASAADISALRESIFYQLDEADCKRLLVISGNDVNKAADKFYDTDPSSLQNLLKHSEAKWDETAFGGAAYGNEDVALPTFNIDYAPGFENYPHSNGHSRAPTRPPSRTSQRSVLSTHAGDAPMQSIESTQESGLVGTSKPAFGPATQSSYDASQWALVSTATEVIADPIPSQRQREQGQPAILKPSPNFNYLPALIPILHSIPLYRNALLTPSVTQDDYWMGDDWWKGIPSTPSRIIDQAMGLAETHKRDIIHETQRLMAFLDNTDRIYGSVGALLDLDAWREYEADMPDRDDDMLKFLLCWSDAYRMLTPDVNLDGSLKTIFNVAGSYKDTFLLDGDVTRNTAKPALDIYDVLDDALFSSAIGSAHITEISNVLIFRLTSSTTTATDLGCRVPATLYVDRYLEQNKPVIDSMYNDIKSYEEQVSDISAKIDKIKWHTPRKADSKRVETLKLLRTSMAAFEPPTDGSEPDTRDETTLQQLQQLLDSIEQKLKTLDEEAAQIQKAMQEVSNRFKPVIDDGSDVLMDATEPQYPKGQTPQDAMTHPYKLCGVATRHDVVYLLHPDIKSDVTDGKQWWRMQYDTESSNPTIRRDKQTLQEVLERATTESASVLLVYANDDATSIPPLPLSKPLEDFVKRDKLNFLEELQKSASSWEAYGEDYGNIAQGGWEKDLPDYGYGDEWNSMSAQQYHTHDRNDSNMSSTTLTPNTEIGDDGPVMREMIEINGGMDAMTGYSREEVSGNSLELSGKTHGKAASIRDVEMMESSGVRTQHVEVAEKKGG
ncbi:hypothetical protein ACN47E_010173 [Coniothyrium glycines]